MLLRTWPVAEILPVALTLILTSHVGQTYANPNDDGSSRHDSKTRSPHNETSRIAPPNRRNSTTVAFAEGEPSDRNGLEQAHPFPRRVPVPDFPARMEWINSRPLQMRDLKGKFVLLDFWTYCCINCIHVLPELKKLEIAYPKTLVVIGVHSAKFDAEKDTKNIKEAVLRYEIEHPVVNDHDHQIWNTFGVRSWPTYLLIDPDGNAVYGEPGEFKFEQIDELLKAGIPYYRHKGKLDETPVRFELAVYDQQDTPLRFPGKVLADEATNRLFIADSNHNRIVVANLDGKLIDTIGSGAIGDQDGDYQSASFNHPQGMALHGNTLYVADTENHRLRRIDLTIGSVATIAGTGKQARNAFPGFAQGSRKKSRGRWVGRPRQTALNSPWALWVHDDVLYIAMAGPHQIWHMPLDKSEIGPYAGNGREDIVDGPLLPSQPYGLGFASFAQPSGLASDGKWLFVADSEGSSIRAVPFDKTQDCQTVIGTSRLPHGRLFAFGDVDSDREEVTRPSRLTDSGELPDTCLQHVLGVVFHDGLLYATDTYNNKIKVVDPNKYSCQTIAGTGQPGRDDVAGTFDEPEGISYAAGKLYVADTNNHLIRTVDLTRDFAVNTLAIDGLSPPPPPEPSGVLNLPGARKIHSARASIKPVEQRITFRVQLELPPGWKLNPNAPMSYVVHTEGKSGPVDRAASGNRIPLESPAISFPISLPVTGSGMDKLTIATTFYYCQDSGIGLCKVTSPIWAVPVQVENDARQTELMLNHVAE